ncbi:MAG: hypothetical protein OJF51_004832 [Nitrospira sp.]|nr:MAG: hypothetical protein OJF51_004832 [Nitrospira sp.]
MYRLKDKRKGNARFKRLAVVKRATHLVAIRLHVSSETRSIQIRRL